MKWHCIAESGMYAKIYIQFQDTSDINTPLYVYSALSLKIECIMGRSCPYISSLRQLNGFSFKFGVGGLY
jgi:hypothetical protein